mgnify:CR=1 FL=1
MDSITAGSQHIVKILLDETDNRPIWLQAWGGTNTIARALKTIEEEYPEKMKLLLIRCVFSLFGNKILRIRPISVHIGESLILRL